MKRMKKALSFVLVLALVLGSFSMAFAADATPTGLSDIKGNANEEAIKVANDLGIVTGYEGKFNPEKDVNRAEFAAMVTRALAIPESALAGYSKSNFKDTQGYDWAVKYLAFCESKGIMLGDGQGNAMPGKTINVNEAVTMVLRAVGYTNNSSLLVGAWPSNYVTVAQNLKMYDKIASVANVDKANSAQLIYNALSVQKVAVNTDGKTEFLTTNTPSPLTPVTMLTAGLGCTESPATVINGTETALINVRAHIGDYAIPVKNKDGKIVAIKEVKSTALTGKFTTNTAIATLNVALNDGGKFKVGDVEYNVNYAAPSGLTGFENSEDKAGVFAGVTSATSLTLNVKLDGKTIKELYSVEAWPVTEKAKISAAQLKAIADKELLGQKFAKNDDKAIDMNSFELVGVASLDKIAADNIVYVYADSKVIRKVAVGTEKVTGVVTKLDNGAYTIGGKAYKKSAEVGALADLQVGYDVNVLLDADGKIYSCDKIKGAATSFAVVKKYQSGITDEVLLYTTDKADKRVELAGTVTNVAGSGSGYTIGAITETFVIGYGLNKDGKLDSANLNTVTLTYDATDTTWQFKGNNVVAGTSKSAVTTYAISKDVVVFTSDAATKKYDVTTIDNVKKNANVVSDVKVVFNANNKEIVAMIVLKAATGVSSDSSYGVINTKVSVYNTALEKAVPEFTGFVNGAAFGPKMSANENPGKTTDSAITLYKVEFDKDGLVTTLTEKVADDKVSGAAAVVESVNGNAIGITVAAVTPAWYQVGDKAVVYKAEKKDGKYTYSLSSLDNILKGYTVTAFDTDGEKAGFEVVVYVK